MAELEKVQLLNFDIDQYLKDGDATVAACAQAVSYTHLTLPTTERV